MKFFKQDYDKCDHCKPGYLKKREIPGFEDRPQADRPYAMMCDNCNHSPYAVDPTTGRIIEPTKKRSDFKILKF